MKAFASALAPWLGAALLTASCLTAAVSYPAPKPPSSIEPEEKTAPVRVSHRHHAIVECVRVPKNPSCIARVADGDTAAVVRFESTAVAPAAFAPSRPESRVVFPHRTGPQEQTIDLPVGDWLVDCAGAPNLARLSVQPGARMQVTLTTISGACQLKADHCELQPGMRERRVRVSEGR